MSEDLKNKEKINQKFTVIVFISALIFCFSFIVASLRTDQTHIENQIRTFMPLLLIAFLIIVLLLKYLQNGSFWGTKSDTNDDLRYSLGQYKIEKQLKDQQTLINHLRADIDLSKSKISNIKTVYENFSAEQKEEFFEDIKNRIQSTATEEFLEDIKQKTIVNTNRGEIIETIDINCSKSLARLNNETSALSRRGNLNLVLGILTTITGLFILYIYVSRINITPKEPLLIVANFIPRLTLVIFIELFAYFFLKLYKTSLTEIKYFQNELTNIESKYVSLKTAVLINDEKVIGDVLINFSITERNFILEKGQSTIELEQYKTDSQTVTGALSLVSDLIKKLKIIQ